MAVIGQQLSQPEEGWRRIDSDNQLITYEGTWSNHSDSSHYGGNAKFSSIVSNKISFYFKGTKIRFIGANHSSLRSNKIEIIIDGESKGFVSQIGATTFQSLNYEVQNLKEKTHFVEVYIRNSGNYYFDAIDIDINGDITGESHAYMILKNPKTNQHYSLAEKTLISLPDASSKNMILHGIEAGKEIQLDEAFDKIQYVNELSTATQGTSGKIITQKLLESINKVLRISEVKS